MYYDGVHYKVVMKQAPEPSLNDVIFRAASEGRRSPEVTFSANEQLSLGRSVELAQT